MPLTATLLQFLPDGSIRTVTFQHPDRARGRLADMVILHTKDAGAENPEDVYIYAEAISNSQFRYLADYSGPIKLGEHNQQGCPKQITWKEG